MLEVQIQRNARQGGMLSGARAAFVSLALVAAILFSSKHLPIPSVALYFGGIALFFGLLVSVPALRLNTTQVLNPRNLMLFSFALKVIVGPVLIGLFGYSQGLLPNLPALNYIHEAYSVYLGAFLSSVAGYAVAYRGVTKSYDRRIPNWLLALLMLSFVAAAVQLTLFVRGTADELGTSTSAFALILNFVRGLAPLAVMYAVFGRGSQEPGRPVGSWQLAMSLALLIVVTFSTNRASVIYPVVALFTVYTLYNPRIRYWQIGLVGLLTLSAAFWAGQARERYLLGEQTYRQVKQLSRMDNAVENAQVYFNAPQFGAYGLRELTAYNRTLIPSLLESTPILGRQYRQSSGSFWFNFRIYGNTRSKDQVYPAPIEAYVNGGWLAVLMIYGAVGILVAFLQRLFLASQRTLPLAYTAAYLTLLLCGSINLSFSVVGQFMFYSALPLIAFMGYLTVRNYR